MRKLLLVLALLVLTTQAHAERWIVCTDTTIGTVNFERPSRREGDCLNLGLCSGANNTGLAINVFEAVGTEWDDAVQANKKCDRVAVAGSRIINLTAQEIQDIADALASQVDSQLRESAKSEYNGQTTTGQALRCLADVTRKEINILRGWTVSLKAETAAASNLADFKTRVATLSDLTDRTLAQLKTAIQNCVDSGDVDE